MDTKTVKINEKDTKIYYYFLIFFYLKWKSFLDLAENTILTQRHDKSGILLPSGIYNNYPQQLGDVSAFSLFQIRFEDFYITKNWTFSKKQTKKKT